MRRTEHLPSVILEILAQQIRMIAREGIRPKAEIEENGSQSNIITSRAVETAHARGLS
jgi:hypothetical protein